jgi:pyruvate dehydrogenase complex dehydrogenase (E1) component|tara:strand:+ start:66 stop:455 length:390 start_codon:yes stop_codon:yes gene_type:complete
MSDLTADKLVAMYIKIRSAINKKDDEIKHYKEQQEKVSNELLALCNEQNLDSMKTTEGTITRRVSSHFWTSDWEAMYKFIEANNAHHLLEKRIHTTHMKEFLADNPDECPHGLQSNTKYIVSVRKPTAK